MNRSVTTIVLVCVLASTAWTQDKVKLSPELQVYPLDIAVSDEGVAYVADRRMHGVWQWKDGKVSELFRGSPKFRTPMNAARTVAIDADGSVLVGDTSTREIYRITNGGKPEPITGGKIGTPMDMAVTSDGTIYVADLELRKLMRIPAGSKDVEHIADVNPRGVAVDSKDQVWVVSQNPQQLLIVSPDGSVKPIVSKRTFDFPHQVAISAAGEAYVTDGYAKAIWKVVPGEEPKVWFKGEPLDNPVGITLVDDLPVIVDPRARKVFKFDASAKPTVWFSIDAN